MPNIETNNERTMQQYTMRGYVARDKKDGISHTLYFGPEKPIYDEELGIFHDFGDALELPDEWFPELKYTDEPIEVELIIKRS